MHPLQLILLALLIAALILWGLKSDQRLAYGHPGEGEEREPGLHPYYSSNPERWVLIPTLTVCCARCGCCGTPAAYLVSLDWLPWTLGFEYVLSDSP